MNILIEAAARKEAFYNNMKLSSATKTNYRYAYSHPFLKELLFEFFQTRDIFEVADLNKLSEFYATVKIHPFNIDKHRVYSAAVMTYIKYLNNGKKTGKRIDYQKPRPAAKKPRKRRMPIQDNTPTIQPNTDIE